MRGKQGLSTVVTTLIIILLVLVAIGIIWVVVKGVITGSGEQIDINTKCVTTNLEISSASCTAGTSTCLVTVNKAGGYTIEGVKIVFSNSTHSGTASTETGDIVVSKTFSLVGASSQIQAINIAGAMKVKLAAYFTDAQDQQVSCPGVSEADVTVA